LQNGKHRIWARQSGIALISVLWVGVALGALAAAIVSLSRSDVDLAHNQLVRAEAQLAADSAVRVAIYAMLNQADSAIAADGSVTAWLQPQAEIRLQVTSEHGRIDLNRAGPELIESILQVAGIDSETAGALAAAIADYTDPDEALTPLGAERPDYAQAGLSGPKNAPLEHEAELLAVLGMSPEIFDRVADAFTVHSGRRAPKRGQEHPLVKTATGLDAGAALAATAALESLPPAFSLPLDAAPQLLVEGEGPKVTDLVRIRAEVTTRSGAVAVRVAVVGLFARAKGYYAVRAWRTDRPVLFPG
jgi:general secretion pathway protein K